MDIKEVLYELSLKFNTLKMYENTIEQMKANGKVGESLNKIIEEKDGIEREINALLIPDDDIKDNENGFIKALDEKKDDYYSSEKDFFADFGKENDKMEYKKPLFADIQEKISNSQWINSSNFIFEFPKDEIDIDEWRVSGFYYQRKPNVSCSTNKYTLCSGELFVSVNDFAEVREDGKHVILEDIVNKLTMKGKSHVVGDIYANIISNDGNELYSLCFKNCRFTYADCDGFSYENANLRRVNLHFEFDEMTVYS